MFNLVSNAVNVDVHMLVILQGEWVVGGAYRSIELVMGEDEDDLLTLSVPFPPPLFWGCSAQPWEV